jgi:hypothetical protein
MHDALHFILWPMYTQLQQLEVEGAPLLGTGGTQDTTGRGSASAMQGLLRAASHTSCGCGAEKFQVAGMTCASHLGSYRICCRCTL